MRPSPRHVVPALLMVLAASAPSPAQVKDHRQIKFPPMRAFTVPQPERHVLDSGMVVLLLEDHELPLVQAVAVVRTGARLQPAGKTGLAEVFGPALRTGGTARMTGDQVDDYLEGRAATIESNVETDSASVVMSCLTQDFPDVLKVFADVLRTPAFSEDKIKIAKNGVTAGIARRNDNPQSILFREFQKLVYGADSPYARVPEYATLANVSRDDLLAFHKTYFTPNRVIVGVTGDFRTAEVLDRLRQAFGNWPKGPEPKDAEAAYQKGPKPGISYVQKEDMTQSNIIMGHLGIRKDDPDFFAVEILNEAFGGSFAARLFSNIRSRKGLAYSVRGTVSSNYDYPGWFNAWMTTKTETTAAGIDALLEEIDLIVKNPPSLEEVTRAKESILNSFVFNFDSPGKIMRQQITYEYFGFPRDYLAKYRQNIEKVAHEDVARVAKKFIHKDQLAILVVGPAKGHDRPLESFGPVAKVDIAIPEPKAVAAPAATAESASRGAAVFAKVLEGLGGRAAVERVKSLRTVASAIRKAPQGGGDMTLKVVSTIALPDRMHQELTTPMGQIVIVMSGQDAFMNTPAGTQPLPQSQRTEAVKALQRQPITLAQHAGDADFKVQHVGSETLDGLPVEVLLVTRGDDQTRLFVDQGTGRILRQAYQGQSVQGPGEFVISYSDFRSVSGATLPFRTQTTFNGEPQETRVVEEITLNPSLDPSLFEKPGGAASGGAGSTPGGK